MPGCSTAPDLTAVQEEEVGRNVSVPVTAGIWSSSSDCGDEVAEETTTEDGGIVLRIDHHGNRRHHTLVS